MSVDDVVIKASEVHKTFMVKPETMTVRDRLRGRRVPREVLKGVSMSVQRGEVVALLGSSGSGKSTLLRCMNRLETIGSGTIEVHGEVMGKVLDKGVLRDASASELARQRSEVGMVFQHFNLFPNKTALGNVMAPLRAVRKLNAARAREIALKHLTDVGLADRADSFPSGLSGGQKQRVAIARALAMNPQALLLDEPTSALDPELVGEVLAVIKRIAQAGTTMVIVTHEVNFARDIADRILIMDDGKIVEQGDPEELFRNPQHERTKNLLRGRESNPSSE